MLPETATHTVGGYTIQLEFHEPRPITSIPRPEATVDVKSDVRALYGALMKARRNRKPVVRAAWGNNMKTNKGANEPPKRKRNNNGTPTPTPKSPNASNAKRTRVNNNAPNAKRTRVNNLLKNFKPMGFTIGARGVNKSPGILGGLFGPTPQPRAAWAA